jgi:hypothetical protein
MILSKRLMCLFLDSTWLFLLSIISFKSSISFSIFQFHSYSIPSYWNLWRLIAYVQHMGIGQYYINIRPIFGFVAEPEHGLLVIIANVAFCVLVSWQHWLRALSRQCAPHIVLYRHSLYFSHVVSVGRSSSSLIRSMFACGSTCRVITRS